MIWTYILLIAFTITIIINLLYFINRNKYKDLGKSQMSILINQGMKSANYMILANVIISIIGAFLNHNGILINNGNKFIMLLYVSSVLLVSSSAIGVLASIFSLGNIIKTNRELMTQLPTKAKMRFFSQFALFVFGMSWFITDSIIAFDWNDIWLRIITMQKIQYTPTEGVIYFIFLFIVANFKLFDMTKVMDNVTIPLPAYLKKRYRKD